MIDALSVATKGFQGSATGGSGRARRAGAVLGRIRDPDVLELFRAQEEARLKYETMTKVLRRATGAEITLARAERGRPAAPIEEGAPVGAQIAAILRGLREPEIARLAQENDVRLRALARVEVDTRNDEDLIAFLW